MTGLEIDPAKQLINIVLAVFAGMDSKRFIRSRIDAEPSDIQTIPSRFIHRHGGPQISAIGCGNKREQEKRKENANDTGLWIHLFPS